ncbi:hypothetical protein MTR67_004448 [Solanum verrucosum]|uniref:Uncharacterized protein n=1 Tax=Solanum verrucosum TaxID=315347 RepID=A0AAF0TBD3_SOLVR|nr:hypothetical protein MTR67_004448 [Solanum verrucosum]
MLKSCKLDGVGKISPRDFQQYQELLLTYHAKTHFLNLDKISRFPYSFQ